MRKFFCLLLLSTSLFASCNYLYVDTGYRWDRLDNRTILFGEAVGSRASSQVFERINSYQLGLVGKAHLCSPFFLKGAGHYGWIGSGDYHELLFFGDLRGNTWDVKGALGYTFNTACFGFAPVLGWAYDVLDLEVQNTKTTIVLTRNEPTRLSNIDCRQSFNGPFVGLDLFFRPLCWWDLTFTYELHRAWWKGKRIPSSGDFGPLFGTTTGFANVRTLDRMWGNLFEIDCDTHFWSCWTVGFALKYQIWQNQNTGKYKRTITPLSPLFTNRLIENVDWQSFSATLHLGVDF